MAPPNLTYLRKLLGDAWVDAEVFGEKPSHWLGLWQKKDPANVWVPYAESLVHSVLSIKKISADAAVLTNKLKSPDIVSTLAEMESAVFLAEQGFTVTVEPIAPLKGPDLRADWQGVPYFVEIRTIGRSEYEERRNSVTNEIFSKLNSTPSSYSLRLTVSDEYEPGSLKLRDAIAAILTSLEVLKDRGAKSGRLHFAGKGDAVLELPGVTLNPEHFSIIQRSDFTVEFAHLGKELAGTPATYFEPIKNPPEPVKDHGRLKGLLQKKRKQLPSAARGIILFDVSELFMLSEFSIERALYGDAIVEFPRVKSPGQAVGQENWRRSRNGFLLHTSRVSAVVFQRRELKDGSLKITRKVYPTNRADADTIRLKLAELERFGDLGDHEHLSAENAPSDATSETEIR
jgi:hypothetical protein